MTEDDTSTAVAPFKRCSCCQAVWLTRDDFLSDPDVGLIGYQAHFEELQAGLILFNHSCHTTLAIKVECLHDLYDGPIFQVRATDGPDCQGYCHNRGELRPCPAQCECAYVREILQIVRNWQKRKAA